MNINWDWLIGTGIIIGLILTIWAKVSGQTIAELIRDIREIFTDTTEEVGEGVISYYD